MTEKNKPVATKKFGVVVASIWKNEGKDGKTFHSVTVERLYKPKNSDQWKSTSSFDRDDLPKLVQAVNSAYRCVMPEESRRLSSSPQAGLSFGFGV